MAKRTKRNRKPYLGNKFRITSAEAKLLTAQMAQNMQAVLSWVMALDKRLRALEPQPEAAQGETSPETEAQVAGEPYTLPTSPQNAPDATANTEDTANG